LACSRKEGGYTLDRKASFDLASFDRLPSTGSGLAGQAGQAGPQCT